ncbi:TrmH family RNA methyltransferase [Bacteroides zoogleoformans]|uniref:RNA methyltransferase n=1 Tax=Bacteroides zoogleoformans TaxID=28119 RepID=A0ABN5IL71_9BACE|nr:RNA methyltransferase [Bacteroides zoogleoformans]AVM53452.1 RNA methyltransferase [Bacteroides zoogleoformans]TWJ17213.1 TrmH family RNA methyltransferase [Bacteroides zoogleoformans]
MALSKNRIKYIRSLELKKNRKADKVFLAEGPKLVEDLLGRFPCLFLLATAEWFSHNSSLSVADVTEVSEEELSRASLLKAPQQVLAVFRQPDDTWDSSIMSHSLCLALDDVQDPGNLGTIIRLADWFGIEHIFCSPNTVDAYNPKTVQATMGGIARVKLHYTPLPELIESLNDVPVYGTFLNGENIYTLPLSSHGLIVMGNEGNGIGKEVKELINRRLYIPSYPAERKTSESLNVAIATAVVCAEFRRRGASL